MLLRACDNSLYTTSHEMARFLRIEPSVVNLEIQKVIDQLLVLVAPY